MSDHNTIFQPVNDFVQAIIYLKMQNFRYRRSVPELCDRYTSDMNAILEDKTGCSEEAKGFIEILEVLKEEYNIDKDNFINNSLIRLQ